MAHDQYRKSNSKIKLMHPVHFKFSGYSLIYNNFFISLFNLYIMYLYLTSIQSELPSSMRKYYRNHPGVTIVILCPYTLSFTLYSTVYLLCAYVYKYVIYDSWFGNNCYKYNTTYMLIHTLNFLIICIYNCTCYIHKRNLYYKMMSASICWVVLS